MDSLEETFKRWSCPSDRELTLRAKMKAGWSSRANELAIGGQQPGLSELEQAKILHVLERARKLESQEEERLRKLNDRLEYMKRQACGRGSKNCILCNEEPRLFRRFYHCKDCGQPVCSKCSLESADADGGRPFWLCKICFESRELLKKSNQWLELCPSAGVLGQPQEPALI